MVCLSLYLTSKPKDGMHKEDKKMSNIPKWIIEKIDEIKSCHGDGEKVRGIHPHFSDYAPMTTEEAKVALVKELVKMADGGNHFVPDQMFEDRAGSSAWKDEGRCLIIRRVE